MNLEEWPRNQDREAEGISVIEGESPRQGATGNPEATSGFQKDKIRAGSGI